MGVGIGQLLWIYCAQCFRYVKSSEKFRNISNKDPGFFYGGFGAILTPIFGVTASYGSADSPEYNNALGFWVLMWAVLNLFFMFASAAM